MDKNYDQPLPPGVVSLPSSLPHVAPSVNPSTNYPNQSFQNSVNPHHQFHYAENNLFHGPPSNAALAPPPQSFYPHFNPSTQFNHAQYAPRIPDQFVNNFQNNNFTQFGMPTGHNFRHNVPGSVMSAGSLHSSFHSPMESDASQPQSGSPQDGGPQRTPQLAELNAPPKHAKEEDADELQQVKLFEVNHRNKGELGCPEPVTDNLVEQQSQKQNEIGKTCASKSLTQDLMTD